jgi:hypothetical protein
VCVEHLNIPPLSQPIKKPVSSFDVKDTLVTPICLLLPARCRCGRGKLSVSKANLFNK